MTKNLFYFYNTTIMVLELVTFTLISSLFFLKWHLEEHFSQFGRLGIPGPKPSILFGNLKELRQKGQFQAVKDWTKTYKRVFGYFEGYTPVLAVSDPYILKQVLMKDAANFMKRMPFPLAPRNGVGLFIENGHQWRRSRTLLTPAFSTGKLKKMSPIMSEAADVLVERLEEKSKENQELDIYRVFQGLTLDVIGRCAFGLQTHAQMNDDDQFLVMIRNLFHVMTTTLIKPLVLVLPFLSYFIFALKNIVFLFGMNPVVWLRNNLREVIKTRKEMGPNSKIIDLIQLMLFPETWMQHKICGDVDNSKCGTEHDSTSNHKCTTTTTNSNNYDVMLHPMTDREIVAQSMTFLLAGYETTSAVLAFFCHEVAKHPEVQDRIYQETINNIGTKKVDYETIQDLHYFDTVFDEVCRLYPTAAFIVTRQAFEGRCYGNITIPAGMNILANIWALHRDSEFWEDPEEFKPERFEDAVEIRKSFTFLPFGAGPRHCIGMRFATIEAKITLIKLIMNFTLEKSDYATGDLEVLSRGAIVPKDIVNVKVTKRVDAGIRRRRNRPA